MEQSIEEYLNKLEVDRLVAIEKLRKIILYNLPKGFFETISYGMIGYVVPHSIYPNGYHCNPKLPLPFISIASQKNFISFYHMGMYAMPGLLEWFTERYSSVSKMKLDVGKSCIRFKKVDEIPYEIIGELCSKLTPDDWIALYERNLKI